MSRASARWSGSSTRRPRRPESSRARGSFCRTTAGTRLKFAAAPRAPFRASNPLVKPGFAAWSAPGWPDRQKLRATPGSPAAQPRRAGSPARGGSAHRPERRGGRPLRRPSRPRGPGGLQPAPGVLARVRSGRAGRGRDRLCGGRERRGAPAGAGATRPSPPGSTRPRRPRRPHGSSPRRPFRRGPALRHRRCWRMRRPRSRQAPPVAAPVPPKPAARKAAARKASTNVARAANPENPASDEVLGELQALGLVVRAGPAP